jgi:hypothetical protein
MSRLLAGAPLLAPLPPPLAPPPLAPPFLAPLPLEARCWKHAYPTPASGRLWNATRTGGWPGCECPLHAAADVAGCAILACARPYPHVPANVWAFVAAGRCCRELGQESLALRASCFPDCKNETFQFLAPLASLIAPLEALPGLQQLLIGLGLTGTLPG